MNQTITPPLSSDTGDIERYHKRPQLVLHAESNPFGQARKHSKTAREVFEALVGEDVAFSRFVGFLCTGEATYICFPKVFNAFLPSAEVRPDREWLGRAHLLRRALVAYSEHKETQRAVQLYAAYVPDRSDLDEMKPVSHLALAQRILDDFLQLGLWRDRAHRYERGGSGVVDWSRTIARGEALWVNGGRDPIYPTPTVKRPLLTDQHPLSIAQLLVLHDLRALYGPILHEGELVLPPPPRLSVGVGLDGEGLPSIASRLRRCLRGLNEQRARRLADLLIKYIELDDHGRKDQLDIFGTTSFEVIFEHMCAEVFGSEVGLLEKKQLGQVQWRFNERLADRIGETERTGRAQRPDLLVRGAVVKPSGVGEYVLYRLRDPEGDQLLVLDAKYYDIIGALRHTSGESASYLPGLEDVRKQYAYTRWIEHHLKEGSGGQDGFKPKEIVNGLLFPTFDLEGALVEGEEDEPPFEPLGAVDLGGEQIKVLGVNIDWLMRAYARGERRGLARV